MGGKSGVLEHKSGNISETRKDRGKVNTMRTHQRSFEWYHSPPLRPPLPQDWGFATPTQNSVMLVLGLGPGLKDSLRTRLFNTSQPELIDFGTLLYPIACDITIS